MRRRTAVLLLALAGGRLLATEAPLVLFDEAHGQRFLVGREGALDLSTLGEAFRQAGARVESTSTPLTAEFLARFRVVVLSGAFAPLAAGEQEALLAFLERGGRLAVMLHIGPPLADFLGRLGVVVSNGVIRESDGVLAGDPINFLVRRLGRHPVTSDLAGFAVYGCWALLPEGVQATAIAETQQHAWVDLNRSGRYDEGDAMRTFAVAVAGTRGQGRFVVFGDDALFQNQFLGEGRENRRLAANLAAWLLGTATEGEVARALPSAGGATAGLTFAATD